MRQLVFISLAVVICTSCGNQNRSPHFRFQHHYIATDLPGEHSLRAGVPALADLDRDGDLDFALSVSEDSLFWYEHDDFDRWTRRGIGIVPTMMLGSVTMDVDQDGWIDILTGGVWFRNPGEHGGPFDRFEYDSRISTEIHDVAVADIDGNGTKDIVVLGDKEGCFWYDIPEEPTAVTMWERTTITLDVHDHNDDIHGGLAPNGVGDLDSDGDPDVVLAGWWMENEEDGGAWTAYRLPYGGIGYWGHSFRSWIADMEGDGDPDIIVTDCDQKGSRAVWLENDGDVPPAFTVHLLPHKYDSGTGSFHSLAVADFDLDGDDDVFTVEQEDTDILPPVASPRWFIWERLDDPEVVAFEQHLIFDGGLGGHDALVGDVDGDGDPDICSKIWSVWPGNANGGEMHADCLENLLVSDF